MLKKIFSVRDIKVSVYNIPFHSDSEIQAVRTIHAAMAQQPDMLISQFPQDYELFQLGEFEDVTGKITSLDTPKFIINLVAIKTQVEQQRVFMENLAKQNNVKGTKENA